MGTIKNLEITTKELFSTLVIDDFNFVNNTNLDYIKNLYELSSMTKNELESLHKTIDNIYYNLHDNMDSYSENDKLVYDYIKVAIEDAIYNLQISEEVVNLLMNRGD